MNLPDDLLIRDAVEADVPHIVALILGGPAIANQHGGLDPNDPAQIETFRLIDADPRQRLIVVELGGRIVATLQITYLPYFASGARWRAQFESVHVDADLRGRGIGGHLIRWAIEQARERGAGMVQLTSNKARMNAHRFYETLGFSRSHEGFKLAL
ncbi:MAG: GNAT family N-acetyltransferase [Hyphomicrobiaceae bacterium]|nr:GNAT family N-acetyltransferase [Hyphomicrobiaceae bacterium]MCC0023206.1 GNAT family N-acetyltransferase [Hyphomicrobiaceae bacterium]